MNELIRDFLTLPFLQYAFLAALLASFACGIVGSFVTVNRITYMAGAIAHSVLGGMGIARYLQREQGILWMTPLVGAVLAALAAAVVISFVREVAREREDTVLSAVWSVGMATGILFISMTRGYSEDLMSYLFGDILMVTPGDLILMVLLDLVLAGVTFLAYTRLVAFSFDDEFALLRGVHVPLYNLLLLCMTALTVVLLVQVVGIVMVIALLTLPAGVASHFTRRLSAMILVAMIVSGLCTSGGLALSYVADTPSGATIILLTGMVYGSVLAGRGIASTVGRA